MAPYRANQQVRVLLRHEPSAAERDGDRVRAVTLADAATGDQVVVQQVFGIELAWPEPRMTPR
ncbi:MAG: hypothetical protein ACJ8CR_05710 [Roseiflexaceae bacterium]